MARVKDLNKYFNDKFDMVEDSLSGFIKDISKRIILRTPVFTGQARYNWNPSIESPDLTVREYGGHDNAPVQQSAVANYPQYRYLAPAESPASRDAYERVKLVAPWAVGDKYYLTNSVEYINDLEHGHALQSANGMVRITVAEFYGIVIANIEGAKNG